MRKSTITIIATITVLSVLMLSPILTSQAFAQMQMDQPFIPPRQQWKMANDISELTCRENHVLLTKINGAPACVSPHAYFKLVDRGWGPFNDSIFADRPLMTQNLMGYMVRDPGLMQPMHNMILQDQQQTQAMSSNWNNIIKQDPQVMRNFMMPIMDNTDLRQQMIDQMMTNQPMMQSMRGNNQMMNMMKGGPMMDQGQMMGGSMGQGMMDKGMMSGSMGQGMMGGSMGQGMMAQPLVDRPMTMRNPDIMNNMMNRMMQNPELIQQMQEMMLQNPYHMQRMMGPQMSSTVGPAMNPMIGPMMNDPELREQMLELMMQNQQFMQSMIENQQLQQQLNP